MEQVAAGDVGSWPALDIISVIPYNGLQSLANIIIGITYVSCGCTCVIMNFLHDFKSNVEIVRNN